MKDERGRVRTAFPPGAAGRTERNQEMKSNSPS